MKAFGCIIISALAICTLVPALGYEVQPLYGRANLLFAPPQTLSPFVTFSSQLTALQTAITALTGRVTTLETTDIALQNSITALTSRVATLETTVLGLQPKPKCPAAADALGTKPGVIINGMCYAIKNDATKDFAGAQTACLPGFLAEPPPTVPGTTTFYNALKAKYPTDLDAILPAWIGYRQAAAAAVTDNFIGQFNGISVSAAPKAPVLANAVVAPSQAATLAVGGTAWNNFDATLTTTAKGYICQYTPV